MKIAKSAGLTIAFAEPTKVYLMTLHTPFGKYTKSYTDQSEYSPEMYLKVLIQRVLKDEIVQYANVGTINLRQVVSRNVDLKVDGDCIRYGIEYKGWDGFSGGPCDYNYQNTLSANLTKDYTLQVKTLSDDVADSLGNTMELYKQLLDAKEASEQAIGTHQGRIEQLNNAIHKLCVSSI